MKADPAPTSLPRMLQVLALLLMLGTIGRLAVVLPDWIAGVPPRSAGLYERRLLSVFVYVPILSVSMLSASGWMRAQSRGRQAFVWALLAISIFALVLDIMLDRRLN